MIYFWNYLRKMIYNFYVTFYFYLLVPQVILGRVI